MQKIAIVVMGVLLWNAHYLKAQTKFGGLTYKVIRDSIVIGTPSKGFTPVFKDTIVIKGPLVQESERFTYIGNYKNDTSSWNCDVFYSENEPEGISHLCIVANDTLVFKGIGNTFHFKGETLYAEGVYNNVFNKKRKYIVKEGGSGYYTEVKQPFYHIGIKGKLKTPLQLYQNQSNTQVLANLPIGYPIEILMASYNNNSVIISQLLIKTKFGLLGWIPMKLDYLKGGLIAQFYNHDVLEPTK